MADNDAKALPEGADAPKKSKLKKFLIIFLILLIILAAGGGGAYWWFFMRNPVDAMEETTTTEEGAAPDAQAQGADAGTTTEGGDAPRIERQSDLPRSSGMVLPLPPFVVNLSDPTGKRYLRLGMEVEVNRDVSAIIKSQSAKIRDAVIILLAGKTFADISSAEGKILLKAEVASRLNQILGGTYVVRVYFTDFIVEDGG